MALIAIIMGLLVSAPSEANDWSPASRDDLVSVLVYRLSEKVQWPQIPNTNTFNIQVIAENESVVHALEEIAKMRTLHGKTIQVGYSRNLDIPESAHVIYLSSVMSQYYEQVLKEIGNRAQLVISDGLEQQNSTMINLFDSELGRLNFSVNKANIINQRLGVHPDIVLLGGTEVDIAQLYHEQQRNLKNAQKELRQLKSQRDLMRSEVNTVRDDYSSLQQELAEQQTRLNQQSAKLAAQSLAIQAQAQELSDKQTEAERLSQLIFKQEQLIARQERNILEEQKLYDELSLRIRESEQSLDSQRQTIEERSAVLAAQNQKIVTQQNILRELESTVSSQKNLLILFGIAIVVASMLAAFVFRINRHKVHVNRQLADQKKLLENNAHQLALTNAKLQIASKEASSANEAKTVFLANISHELRTPLNAIIGFSEMLSKKHEVSPASRELIQIIHRSGTHLLNMINDVLDLSKIEAGRVSLEPAPFDLRLLLEDISAMFHTRAQAAALEFKLVMDESLLTYIECDQGKLKQILINLLGNALKFTSQGGFSVEAKTLATKDTQSSFQLQIKVCDTGPGIPHEELERVFQPFTQSSLRHVETKGTGLGLTISKSFAHIMGGDIKVESTLGQGTCFTLSIPVTKVDSSQVYPLEHKQEVLALAPGQHHWKVLIAEDNLDSARLLQTLLEQVGFEVKVANNGLEAIQKAEEWRPEFIWMDLRMPIMTGYEATRRIRANEWGKNIRIVALTASAFNEQRQNILDAGCDDVMHKPYLASEIFDMMAKSLNLNYLYESVDTNESPKKQLCLSKDLLEPLSPAMRQELSEICAALDYSLLSDFIESIRQSLPDLAAALQSELEQYRFEHILKIIQQLN